MSQSDALSSEISDEQHHVLNVVSPRSDERAVVGPIKPMNLFRSKLGDLLRWAAADWLTPDVRDALAPVDVRDRLPIRTPADTSVGGPDRVK